MEHVINVLARLSAVPPPQNVITTLQFAIAPLADMARYGSLRTMEIESNGKLQDDQFTSTAGVDHEVWPRR